MTDSSFTEFPLWVQANLQAIVAEMNRINKEIHSLQEQLQESRQSFKNKINQHYQQEGEPFPTSENTINSDLEQYGLLVSYCLEAGDTDLLACWGILPIQQDLSKLASHDFWEYYETFDALVENSQVELEAECFSLLSNFFKSLESGQGLPGSAA